MEAVERLKKFFAGGKEKDKRIKLILIIGLAAILLIFASDFSKSCDNKNDNIRMNNNAVIGHDEYAQMLENRLTEIVSSIDGAGQSRVMVTLQNGVEYVYASEDKISHNTSESAAGSGGESRESSEDSESSYIIIDTENGQEALVCTQLMPSVQGVVIVCEGANDPIVVEQITNAVTTALGISPKRVFIALLKID